MSLTPSAASPYGNGNISMNMSMSRSLHLPLSNALRDTRIRQASDEDTLYDVEVYHLSIMT
jgi:hypothetical protein